jgi:hypothetical protein
MRLTGVIAGDVASPVHLATLRRLLSLAPGTKNEEWGEGAPMMHLPLISSRSGVECQKGLIRCAALPGIWGHAKSQEWVSTEDHPWPDPAWG